MAKKKFLNMMSQFRTLSIKIYDEQIPNGWESLCQIIRSLDKAGLQVIAICHNRDYIGDEYWQPSIEKPHYHIIVRVLGGKRLRVKQILEDLGIVFRGELDKILWENHGIESCENFTNMAVYLTHETKQAELDGKEKYELEELVSNLTVEEIRQVREGYTRVDDSSEKVTPRDIEAIANIAFELGRNLKDFEAWRDTLPFNVFSHSKTKYIREKYERGKTITIEELKNGKRISRLCVFIQSDKGMGKSRAAEYALEKLGVKYLNVSGGGTGKFDKLEATHGGIVIDDDTCPHLLQMADTKCYDAYKRGSGNPPWCGEYLIVTSNNSFEEWLDECGFKTEKNKEAARDRFYICHLEKVAGSGRYILYCDSRADRGGDDNLQETDEKYNAFKKYFNESLAEYHCIKTNRERIDINSFEVTPEEMEAYKVIIAKEEEERKRQEEEAKKEAEKREQKHREERDKELWNKARKIWRDRKGLLPFEYALTTEERQEIREIKEKLEEEEREKTIDELFEI